STPAASPQPSKRRAGASSSSTAVWSTRPSCAQQLARSRWPRAADSDRKGSALTADPVTPAPPFVGGGVPGLGPVRPFLANPTAFLRAQRERLGDTLCLRRRPTLPERQRARTRSPTAITTPIVTTNNRTVVAGNERATRAPISPP